MLLAACSSSAAPTLPIETPLPPAPTFITTETPIPPTETLLLPTATPEPSETPTPEGPKVGEVYMGTTQTMQEISAKSVANPDYQAWDYSTDQGGLIRVDLGSTVGATRVIGKATGNIVSIDEVLNGSPVVAVYAELITQNPNKNNKQLISYWVRVRLTPLDDPKTNLSELDTFNLYATGHFKGKKAAPGQPPVSDVDLIQALKSGTVFDLSFVNKQLQHLVFTDGWLDANGNLVKDFLNLKNKTGVWNPTSPILLISYGAGTQTN
jgi:hypothetical protein